MVMMTMMALTPPWCETETCFHCDGDLFSILPLRSVGSCRGVSEQLPYDRLMGATG